MFNGLSALTSVGSMLHSYRLSTGTMVTVSLPLYFKVNDTVLISNHTTQGQFIAMLSGTVTAVTKVGVGLPVYTIYWVTGSDGVAYQATGSAPNYDPSILTQYELNKTNPITIENISAGYTAQLSDQKSWIAVLKTTGLTHQAIINIDAKLTSGYIASATEIDSVRTVFINTSSTAPTQIGMTTVIGVNEQNGLPYPILGVVVGVSPNGNYLAQVGSDYFEFLSGTWQIYSTVANLEAKIADLQTKINNAKAALAAAQARLADLRSKAQALGISV